MKKAFLLFAACSMLMLAGYAQNIAINTDASLPNKNAILDIKSGNKGVLIPRMDSMARKRIPNTIGLLVYDITTDNFWYNTGKEWRCIPNDKDRDDKGSDGWLLKGNKNTKDSVNFLGTTDDVALNIRVNNQPSGRIDHDKNNAFWGYLAGLSNTSGNYNTATGNFALQNNTIAYYNNAFGFKSLYSNTTGSANTAIGAYTLTQNTTGLYNSATGYFSLFSNVNGYGNTANGAFALNLNTAGSANVGNGYNALNANTTGTGNTANGFNSMLFNTTGNSNSANGRESIYFNSSGNNNTANGFQSLYANQTGNYNSVDGDESLYFNTSGSFNTVAGAGAMWNNNTGSHNTAIGNGANVSMDGLTNATVIGDVAIVDASNKVRIGNAAVTVIEGQVPFTTPSDGRYKFNVQENVAGLDFILHLRPVTYQFDVQRFDASMNHRAAKTGSPLNYALQTAYDEATRIRRSGFIAQEVEKAANASGYDFSGLIKPKTDQDHYSLSYDAFVVPLVKAVQEQQQVIALQNAKIKEQDKRLTSLEQELVEIKNLMNNNH